MPLTVSATALDPLTLEPVDLGRFPSLAEALGAAQFYLDPFVVVETPDSPGGIFTIPRATNLLIEAPAGWTARLDFAPDAVALSLRGTADFTVVGTDGNNAVFGGRGHDDFRGGGGVDSLIGLFGDDTLTGGDGDDEIDGGDDRDLLFGDGGNDLIQGGRHADRVFGGTGNDSLYGGLGRDVLDGGALRDALYGGAEADRLRGGEGRDTLDGGPGNDTLVGGRSADVLSGGAGIDIFVFAAGDSPAGFGRDRITDFAPGAFERIDLRPTGFALTFIGGQPFTGAGGEVRFAEGLLAVDFGGDGLADLEVKLDNVSAIGAENLIL